MSGAGNVRKAWRLLKDEGPRRMFAGVLARLSSMLSAHRPEMLVEIGDAAAVDWTVRPANLSSPTVVTDGPVEIAWVCSPPGAESGGHQNLFRFIKFAEDAGHRSTIYLYGAGDSIPTIRGMLKSKSGYPELAADIRYYDPEVGVDAATQAIFATGWETAYPVYRDASSARRFYFVQDFEPYFYPVGSQSSLAENTYRFGFHGITAGAWLETKLRDEFGMPTDHFDFAVDRGRYHITNEGPRSEIFFYARPVTPRRAFELGMLALADFAQLRPDVTINLAGWDITGWKVPFAHRNLASLDVSQLNELYNRCAAGLVLSLTNLSLLPLELMASGVVPVVNDAPNNRLVADRPGIEWVPLSPPAIARRLAEVVARDFPSTAHRMAGAVGTADWADSGRQFLDAFERGMRG